MASRGKKGIWGIGTAIAGLTALAIYNENVASFLEDTKLNRSWTLIEPAFQWFAGAIRFLSHPIMTHIYAVGLGFGASVMALLIIAALRKNPAPDEDMISLPALVEYLTTETEWAKNKRAITDRAVQFALLDVLTTGRLTPFAREEVYGHPSALKRINPSYFDAALIDLNAIRNEQARQITLKPTYTGDHFEHWQFQKSEVERIWPRPREPRSGWRKRLFGA